MLSWLIPSSSSSAYSYSSWSGRKPPLPPGIHSKESRALHRRRCTRVSEVEIDGQTSRAANINVEHFKRIQFFITTTVLHKLLSRQPAMMKPAISWIVNQFSEPPEIMLFKQAEPIFHPRAMSGNEKDCHCCLLERWAWAHITANLPMRYIYQRGPRI